MFSILTFFLAFYLTYSLTLHLASYPTYILTFNLAFYLTYILTFYQAFYLTYDDILSGILSGMCSGPCVPRLNWSSRSASGARLLHLTELAIPRARSDDKLAQGEARRKKKGGKEGRKEGREEGVAPLLKSIDLHLAGGEI
jgi:hypothetical protein